MLQPLVEKGRFVNPGPIARIRPPWLAPEEPLDREPGFRDFWRWQRGRPKAPKVAHVPRAPSVERLPEAPGNGVRATWFGHSSALVQLDGLSFLCDPVWSRRLANGLVVPRLTPPGQAWSALPRIDALLVSHNHFDHLDAPTIQRIPRSTPVFCGLGLGPWFRARGFDRVTQMAWWDTAPLGEHEISFVPAQHFSGRTPWDRDRTLWGGFVVEGPEGHAAYFAGDSGYFRGFREIGERFPRLDVALMPIGAYEPRWFMSPVHVDPTEAVHAFRDTGADTMVPIHWGAFWLADETMDEPPRALANAWKEAALDDARLALLPLGGAWARE